MVGAAMNGSRKRKFDRQNVLAFPHAGQFRISLPSSSLYHQDRLNSAYYSALFFRRFNTRHAQINILVATPKEGIHGRELAFTYCPHC